MGTFTGVFGCYCVLKPMSSSIKDKFENQLAPCCVLSRYCPLMRKAVGSHVCQCRSKNIETRYKPSFVELEKAVEVLRRKPSSS
ncbi:hypothetical protein OK016_27390 [Vibrio chagasii]|nr:hypothetical protein [Vibrio chagasii]